jgi:choline dehydrogenase
MYDVVIVGAGSAGCVLAGRLTEDPRIRVLVLEAGPTDRKMEIRIPAAFTNLFKTPYDWDYSTVAQDGLDRRELYWPRGRTLGGSSSINSQMYVRGRPADFDAWALPGWSWEEVRPLFDRMENDERGHLGLGGPVHVARLRDTNPATHAFVQAAVEVGLEFVEDVNDPVREGVGYTPVTQRNGRRWSAADAYLHPATRRPNLTVLTGAHARRVLFEGASAVGVEYLKNGAVHVARATSEVILSGGAVNSPQLLMLSGIGPADHLRALGIEVVHDLPGVGRNLQDHIAVAVIVSSKQPVSLVAAESPSNLARFLLFRKGMLTSNVGEACAMVRTRPSLPGPDLELIFAPVPFVDHGLVKQQRHGLTIGAVALQPGSRGTIALRSADPLDKPVISPNYVSDPEDLRVLSEGVKLARRIFQATALRPFAAEAIEPDLDLQTDADLQEFLRQQCETLYHPVGTCAMGTGREAVVDPELRVRGLQGLRVVDASVLPIITRGHTNAPTMMIGERAADLIRRSAREGTFLRPGSSDRLPSGRTTRSETTGNVAPASILGIGDA